MMRIVCSMSVDFIKLKLRRNNRIYVEFTLNTMVKLF